MEASCGARRPDDAGPTAGDRRRWHQLQAAVSRIIAADPATDVHADLVAARRRHTADDVLVPARRPGSGGL